MVDAATSIIHYKHISASLYSANSVSTISFYHVLRQISIVLSHYVIRYNKLRKFQNRRIENSPQNKGQGQRHLVE